MRHRWWFGLVALGLLIVGGLVWAGTTGTPAFVDATGKVVPSTTIPRWMWVPAAVCIGTTPGSVLDLPATSPAVATCLGTLTQSGTLDFADAANLSAQLHYRLPTAWTGNIDLTLHWLSGTTGTANVVWQLRAACVADGEAADPAAWDTDILAITDANKATANQLNTATGILLTTSHLSGCAAGEIMHIQVFRDSAHASDALAATARLIGIEFVLRHLLS